MEGLPIAGHTVGPTSVSRKFSTAVGSAFLAPLVLVALLPDATFTLDSVGNQENYHE